MRKTGLILLSLFLFTVTLVYAGAIVVPQNTSQLPDSPGYRYVTDAQKSSMSALTSTVTASALSALSGTNTGDETQATIKSKLGAATDGNDGYITAADHLKFNSGLLQNWAALGGALPITNCPPTPAILAAAAALGFGPNQIFCVVFPQGTNLIGTNSYIGIGSLTATGNGLASLSGVPSSLALGSLTALAYSAYYAYPSGIGSTIATGSLVGHGAGNIVLLGVANIANLGVVIGSSSSMANVAVYGIASSIGSGTLTASGAGYASLTGLAESAVMGSVTGTASGGVSGITLLSHTIAGTTGMPSSFQTSSINTTGASLIIVGVAFSNPQSGLYVDDQGATNTWHLAGSVYDGDSTYGSAIFYTYAPNTSTGHRFTVHGVADYWTIEASAWSGTLTTAGVYQASSYNNGDSGGPGTSSSYTPSQTGALMYGFESSYGSNGGTASLTYPSGGSILDSVTNGNCMDTITAYWLATNTTTTSFKAGYSGDAGENLNSSAVFLHP